MKKGNMMLSQAVERVRAYNKLQQMFLLKALLSGFTQVLFIAILTMEIVTHFAPEIVLVKNYLMHLPLLLIVVPVVKQAIRKAPVLCYRLKGLLSVIGCFMLLATEIFELSKVWYLVDAAIISFTGLLMMLHSAYYKSYVIDKCKTFSEDVGYTDLISKIAFVVVGLAIVYYSVPTLVLLILVTPLELCERYFENRCVDIVYKD